MTILRYILTDIGITLIVDRQPNSDERAHLQAQFDDWAQVVSGSHFPVLILKGDQQTQISDLRSAP